MANLSIVSILGSSSAMYSTLLTLGAVGSSVILGFRHLGRITKPPDP